MIIKFSLLILSLLIAASVIPGITINGLYPAVIASLLFVVASFTVKPLLTILTLPVHILTLGLFSFFINAFILWFLSTFIEGFTISGVVAALLAAIIVAVGHTIGGIIT